MLNQISNLGKTLSKEELRTINGGKKDCMKNGICFDYGLYCAQPSCQCIDC